MKLGFFGIGSGRCSDPEVAVRVAVAAENAGLESVWCGEHVVLPDPQAPPSPVPPLFGMLDPTVVLAFLAGHTRTLKLGTGIIIVPQRNPLVLAKELATLDVVSGGRLVFGLGVGYLKAEFDALGAPFERRGERTTDSIEAIRTIWTQDQPAYDGAFAKFANVQARPQPIQKPHPPFVVGGHSPAAFRRAVEHGNGWYGFALDVDGTRACVEGIAEAAKHYKRPAALGELEISVTPIVPLSTDVVRRFQDLGVTRLIPMSPGGAKPDDLIELVEYAANIVSRS